MAARPRRRKVRTYYGHNIYPMSNSMGMRWEANVNGLLMADTLDGIKGLIRRRLGK